MPASAIALFACLVGLGVYAWRAGMSGRTARALPLIVIGAAAIRAYAASEGTLHEWDERYHAVVARHLVDHPLTPTLYDDPVVAYDYRDWTTNHIWLHKPPVALWLMAGSLRAFGFSEFAVRLPSVLLSTIAVIFTFLIGRRLFGDRIGLLAAAFHAVNGLLVALMSGRSPTDHVDTTLITLFEVILWLMLVEAERERRLLRIVIGGLLGVAILTKWYPALLVLPVWIFTARRMRPWGRTLMQGAEIVVVAAIVVAPWSVYIARTFRTEAIWEWRYGLQHVVDEVEEHYSGPLFYLANMPKFFGELVYIPIAWATFEAVRSRSWALRLLLVWIAIPYCVFSASATRAASYVMIASPAIFVVEALFWQRLARARALASRGSALRAVVLFIFAALPARYVLRPGGPFTIADRHPGWVADIQRFRDQVTGPKPVLFNVPHPIETMFYLPWPAYPHTPDPGEAADLHARGYSIFLYDTATRTLRHF